MIIPIELRFKADKGSKSAFRTEKTIKSHDVNSVEFHITIEGLELTDNHTAKILSIFHTSKSQANVNCEIVEGKIIYKPDTNLISRHEHVTNYVYVYHNNQSLDVREFIYIVDLSKIDETSLEVKEVYDQSYADLLADFEQVLNDYKDNLPQADSVRDDIDEILNQFGVDSQAKLSQYDTNVQQVITDNQTAFGVAETGRQDNYEQAEDIRNQASSQAVADWEQGADALLETVEGNESTRVDAEATRKTAEIDRVSSESTRKTNETTRISNEDARKSAEVVRLASEVDRVNAEIVRKGFYEGFDGEIANLQTEIEKKANRMQEDWITPTLINGFSGGLKYRKTQFNELQIDCIALKDGVVGQVIFVLPLEYRPPSAKVFIVGTSFSANFAKITVTTGGSVILTANGGGSPAITNVTLPLD